MKYTTNWKLLEQCKDGYNLYFRFVLYNNKPVKIYQCVKEIPNNSNEGGYFKKESAKQQKGV